MNGCVSLKKNFVPKRNKIELKKIYKLMCNSPITKEES